LIGNELEQDIIGLFAKNLKAGYTILQIAKLLGKAYPYINRKVNEFITQGILTKTVVGKSHLCHIDLESSQAKVLLTIHALRALEAHLASEPHLEAILSELKTLRQTSRILCAERVGDEIRIVGDPSQKSAMLARAPLLASMPILVLTQDEYSSMREHGQPLFGFELHFTLIGEGR
jgi:hypothetical protein